MEISKKDEAIDALKFLEECGVITDEQSADIETEIMNL